VTGAFGYTGKYITRRLLAMGRGVRTLTGHPDRGAAFNDDVTVAPLRFDRPEELVANLRGASTLYNTYWVRFPRGEVTYERAVENTRTLINAAREAGVRRIVHLSITNPFAGSILGYFAGKSAIEQMIFDSGLAYAILRPTVIFGVEDVLINNIAWLLRHAPVFAMPGSGEYSIQPIYVVDLAEMAVAAGRATGILPVPEHGQDGHGTMRVTGRTTGILPVLGHGQDGHGTTHDTSNPMQETPNIVLDAVGPEIYTFEELVRLIAGKVGSRARIVHTPPWVALLLSRLVGIAVRDVVLTQDEMKGLMAGLLVSKSAPTGRTRLSEWASRHAHLLGRRYASELDRHFRV
jgi:NADH dehydrogenase